MKKKIVTFLLGLGCVFGVAGLTACDQLMASESSNVSSKQDEWGTIYTVETAYAKAQELGYKGALEEFIADISGKDGVDGEDGKDGIGIKDIVVSADGFLTVTLTSGIKIDCGKILGKDGEDGKGVDSVYFNENNELIVKYTDGTSQNVGAIPPCEHEYGAWQVGESATCTSSGYEYQICNTCGYTNYEFEKALGHRLDSTYYYLSSDYGHLVKCLSCEQVLIYQHKYSEDWVYDEFGRWKECVCGAGAEYTPIQGNSNSSSYWGESSSAEDEDAWVEESSNDSWEDSSVGSELPEEPSIEEDAATGLRYQLSNDGSYYRVIGLVSETLTDIAIPSTYKNIPITYIYGEAFDGCSGLNSVTIGENIVSIEAWAFAGCRGLTSIIIPNSVTHIGVAAFHECNNLTSITIGKGVTSIEEYAFTSCDRLTSVTFENPNDWTVTDSNGTVKEISSTDLADTAAAAKYLTDTYLDYAWTKEVHVHEYHTRKYDDMTHWRECSCGMKTGEETHCFALNSNDIDHWEECNCGWIVNQEGHSYDMLGGNESGHSWMCYCGQAKAEEEHIFTIIQKNGTYHWEECNCGVKGNLVEHDFEIVYYDEEYHRGECSCGQKIAKEEHVFAGNGSCEQCGTSGFEYTLAEDENSYILSGLGLVAATDIIIPTEYNGLPVTEIAWGAFAWSEITSIVISESITSIKAVAFEGCFSLTDIIVDENNKVYKSIDGIVYAKDGLTLIQYPAGKQNKQFTIPAGVKTIEGSAFEYCGIIEYIEIPNTVTVIEAGAFYACGNLRSIVIPNGVTEIGGYTFFLCDNLTSITIPDGITSIGKYAFTSCDRLTSVTFENPNDWTVTDSNGTVKEISSTDLADTAAVAKYLTDTYLDYAWTRSDE